MFQQFYPRNLFDPSDVPENDPWDEVDFTPYSVSSEGEGVVEDISPYLRQVDELMKQPRPAYDQYLAHIAGMPDRANYRPNTLSKIGAVLAGLSGGIQGAVGRGIENAREIADYPYMRAFEDWSNRGSSLGAAAKMEETQLKQAYDNLIRSEAQRNAHINAEASRTRAGASASNAETARLALEQPNYFSVSSGGKTRIVDRKGRKEDRVLGDSESALDRSFRGGQNAADRALERWQTTENNTRAMDRVEAQIEGRKDVVGARTKTTSTRDPKKVLQARNFAMRDALQEFPQEAKRIIVKDKNYPGKGAWAWSKPVTGDTTGQKNYENLQKWVEERSRYYYNRIEEEEEQQQDEEEQ